MTRFALECAGVFGALTTLDFVWAHYISAIQSRRPTAAACYASVIISLSGVGAIGYTHDWRLLLPAMAGAFVGTWAAVRRDLAKVS